MVLLMGPVCIAFLFGILIGLAWKPKWAVGERDQLGTSFSRSIKKLSLSWLFMTPFKRLGLASCTSSVSVQTQTGQSCVVDDEVDHKAPSVAPYEYDDCSTSAANEGKPSLLTEKELVHLVQLVEVKDGGPTWEQMMNRFTPGMHYQAWRRQPKIGPPQYRTRTVFEDATPEMVRDFFWDDDFRPKWDDMLSSATTVEECLTTGTMVVNWIRKFPFFCSDREYIIGRRIWESGRSYYCVTKGVDCPSIATSNKLRRVDLYYSSWCIRAVESRRGDGELTACEVLYFHHEDMGIPREIAKLGVRQGMWGAVKKFEPGLRAYQEARASGAALSRCAFMAKINTKIDPSYLGSLGGKDVLSDNKKETSSEDSSSNNIPKILVFGGAMILACSLDQGFLPKAVILGVARKFANIGIGKNP